jgi:hypothetical protein
MCASLQPGVCLLQNPVFLRIKNREDFAGVRYRGIASEDINHDLIENSKQHRPPLVGLEVRSTE